MSYRLSDVVYETRSFWVLAVGDRGYEVYRNGPTASTLVARIGHGEGPNLGLTRAKTEADKRQVIADAEHDKAAATEVKP